MAQLTEDEEIMETARYAFIKESGAALIKKYGHLHDELFTEAGFRNFAVDLLERMTNPWLGDPIERAARDPQRKLLQNDRIYGTIRLALSQEIEPINLAKGALAGLEYYVGRSIKKEEVEAILTKLWQPGDPDFKKKNS